MSLPWKPLVQKVMPSASSWRRRSGKLGMKPRALCAWKHPGMVAKQKLVMFVTLGDTLPAPVGLGHPCHWSSWDLGLREPQPYHEGVSLGTERVGQPVDGEGQVRHHAEVAALHGVLEQSRGLRGCPEGPFQQGRVPKALSPPVPTLALTSPSTDTAPMRFCSFLISLVGPTMSDVPVSTMAWQPLAQKVSVPPSWMLAEKQQEGFVVLCQPSPALPPCPAALTCPAGSASSPAG